MKYLLVLLFLISGLHTIEAQTKRALIVGIGNYPVESGWCKIHGDNDVPLIANALSGKGFSVNNIKSLVNEKATKHNIIKSFNLLIKQAQPNDKIYIHFSTHGQQVVDLNGDEEDGLDEAIIPFDAAKIFTQGVYEGKNHLIDDELNIYLTALRQKIGKSGSLLVVIDACHSGDATRGNGNEKDTMMIRGTAEIFQAGIKKSFVPYPVKPLDWVVISASQSYQNNYEYKLNNGYFGSLSYALKLALDEMSGHEDFKDLPMIEGDRFYQTQKVF
jgi:Caspase domain